MLLDRCPPDAEILAIAAKNKLSEMAIAVPLTVGYRLPWFAPAIEVPLSGHATLASGAVVLERLEPHLDGARFETANAALTAGRAPRWYTGVRRFGRGRRS